MSDHKDRDFSLKYSFLIEELKLLVRGVIVIDKNDIIRYVEYVPEINTEPNYDSALQVAKVYNKNREIPGFYFSNVAYRSKSSVLIILAL